MSEETALVAQDADYTNGDLALTQFNPLMNQEMIVQLGDNLMGVHPAAKEVGKLGMRTVAQLAIMTGANPLPGTNGIHVWVDNKQKICIQFGMGFWRGKVEELGGFAWVDRPRPMTDEERDIWGVGNNEVGFICRAATWEAIKKLRQEEKELGGSLSLKEAREMLYKEGVGVVGLETWGGGDNAKYKEQKQGRSINWTAAERAERDLCRKLAPIFTPNREQMQKTAARIDGPVWDGLGQHDTENGNGRKSFDELNGELFSSAEPEPVVDAVYEEVEPIENEQPQELTEPEPAVDDDLAKIIADCRAWLEEKIKDGLVELGLVMDAAAMTPLYQDWKQVHNALAGEDGFEFPDGFKVNRKQSLYGKPALEVYDWLTSGDKEQ